MVVVIVGLIVIVVRMALVVAFFYLFNTFTIVNFNLSTAVITQSTKMTWLFPSGYVISCFMSSFMSTILI